MKDKVLLVDDDAMILAGLKRHLRNQFRIETALSGEEGLKRIKENGPYAVIVSDFSMPGMNGIEFLCRVKKTDPDSTRMMLTGSDDMTTAIQAVNEGSIFQFHPKPCPADTLGKAIQSGVEAYRKTTTHQMQFKKVQSSLAQASMIQQNLVPKSNPQVEGFDIAGKSIWCDETSGDYYDFIQPADWEQKKIGIVVADVIGHGISSALLMTTARAFFRERVLSSGSSTTLVADVNKRLVRDIEDLSLFMTLFYSEIDITERCFRWVHAGHEPAMLYDPAENSFEALGGKGLALGVKEDWVYEESEKQLHTGQIILIGTDGIKETRNEQNELFGAEQFNRVIRDHAHKSAEDIIIEMFDALERFRFPVEREDDETLVVIKVL
ncbi:MAG: SpoIIE family protein phosphatase [Deltaproteobacteria bacterium]|jgi:serine phosphatase RsbU (regulator of sigma subunit)|nr:SpoIIE family protein phosphatase [Deltaproteobacteria bacterium]